MTEIEQAQAAVQLCPSFDALCEREIALEVAVSARLGHRRGRYWAYGIRIETSGRVGANGKWIVEVDQHLPLSAWTTSLEPILASIVQQYDSPAVAMLREMQEADDK